MDQEGHIPMPVKVSEVRIGCHLDIASAPVIHQDDSKQMISGIRNGDWLPHVVGLPNKRGHFELNVKFLTRSPFWDLLLGFHIGYLSVRPKSSAVKMSTHAPFYINARYDDGRCTPVIADRDMVVVWLQCILRA